LQTQLAEVRAAISADRAALLVATNERLVMAVLEAQIAAETATSNFGELARASQRDALTDTPNRTLMLDRMESAIAMAQRHGTQAAIFFIDLDNFKHINDTLGHAAGDAVLQLVAKRLASAVRDSDAVSRHGGDEFLVLLMEVSSVSDIAAIAQNMLLAIGAPAAIAHQELSLSASLGIAVYPNDSEDPATLIALADAAMYQSKRRGGGQYTFHVSTG
jgi:diguanylate cyclase (GGDEF)-like protein